MGFPFGKGLAVRGDDLGVSGCRIHGYLQSFARGGMGGRIVPDAGSGIFPNMEACTFEQVGICGDSRRAMRSLLLVGFALGMEASVCTRKALRVLGDIGVLLLLGIVLFQGESVSWHVGVSVCDFGLGAYLAESDEQICGGSIGRGRIHCS